MRCNIAITLLLPLSACIFPIPPERADWSVVGSEIMEPITMTDGDSLSWLIDVTPTADAFPDGEYDTWFSAEFDFGDMDGDTTPTGTSRVDVALYAEDDSDIQLDSGYLSNDETDWNEHITLSDDDGLTPCAGQSDCTLTWRVTATHTGPESLDFTLLFKAGVEVMEYDSAAPSSASISVDATYAD